MLVASGLRHLGQSFVAGEKGLLLASTGSRSSRPSSVAMMLGGLRGLKTVRAASASVIPEPCYACGEEMVAIQACKLRCGNCGALLDCEDISGLPR